MWQKCPICDGEGRVTSNGSSSSVHQVCSVCNGAKIISELNGLPAQQSVPTVSKMERVQTAVEWQFEQFFNSFEKYINGEYSFNEYLKRNLEIREQAKQMEKEQMKGMYVEGGFAQMRYIDGKGFITAEQYYNETYNK